MSYVVAEEDDRSAGNIIVLSSAWLTPKKCEAFWPICKLTHQFNKLLQRHEPPSEDWQLIKIKRKFFETDNLILARSKAKEAEYNSDLTDVGEQTTSKRTVKPTKRYIVSSDDEDVNEDIFSHQKLKHKKKLKEIFENSVPAKSPIVSVAGSPVIVDSPKSSNIVDECDNIYVGDILKQQEKNTLKSPVTSSYVPLISESPCNWGIAVPI